MNWRRGLGAIGLLGGGGSSWFLYSNTPRPSFWDCQQAPDLKHWSTPREMHQMVQEYGKHQGIILDLEEIETGIQRLSDQHLLPKGIYQNQGGQARLRFDYLLTVAMISEEKRLRSRQFHQTLPTQMGFSLKKGLTLAKSSVLVYLMITWLPQAFWISSALITLEGWSLYQNVEAMRSEEEGQVVQAKNHLSSEFTHHCVAQVVQQMDCYGCLEESRRLVHDYYDDRINSLLEGRIQRARQQRCLCQEHDTWSRRWWSLPHPFFIDLAQRL